MLKSPYDILLKKLHFNECRTKNIVGSSSDSKDATAEITLCIQFTQGWG